LFLFVLRVLDTGARSVFRLIAPPALRSVSFVIFRPPLFPPCMINSVFQAFPALTAFPQPLRHHHPVVQAFSAGSRGSGEGSLIFFGAGFAVEIFRGPCSFWLSYTAPTCRVSRLADGLPPPALFLFLTTSPLPPPPLSARGLFFFFPASVLFFFFVTYLCGRKLRPSASANSEGPSVFLLLRRTVFCEAAFLVLALAKGFFSGRFTSLGSLWSLTPLQLYVDAVPP